MATGMWTGLLAGYKDVEAKKAAREAHEAQLLEKRKGMAMQLAMKYGTSGLADTVGGAPSQESGGSSIEHLSKVLAGEGIDESVITKMAASGGAVALDKAYKVIQDKKKEYNDVDRTVDPQVFNDIFGTMVSTASPDNPVDFAKLEEQFGVAFEPYEKELIQAGARRPTQVDFRVDPIIGAPKIEEVDKLEARALSVITSSGESEIRSLDAALNQINEAEEAGTGQDLKEAKQWIVNRQTAVKDAVKSASGTGGNPAPLIKLYGNDFFNKMFEADERFKQVPLSPMFAERGETTPKVFTSYEQMRKVGQAGLLKRGDVVSYPDETTKEMVTQTLQ